MGDTAALLSATIMAGLTEMAPVLKEMWDADLDVWVGGSAIRSIVSPVAETPGDIDIYGTPVTCKAIREQYGIRKRGWYACDLDVDSPVTINLCDGIEITSPEEYLRQVDFSVCAAMLQVTKAGPHIYSIDGWLADIEARRVRYIKPLNAISTQSLTRLLKLSRKGYTIAPHDLAGVITALLNSMPYKKHMGAPETRDALTEMFSAFEDSVPSVKEN